LLRPLFINSKRGQREIKAMNDSICQSNRYTVLNLRKFDSVDYSCGFLASFSNEHTVP